MKERSKTALAWWFGPDDRRLGYHDGRQVRQGQTHKILGHLQMCHRGLHASRGIFNAVNYGKGDWIWRVRLSGKQLEGDDKLCAAERTYLWGFKATKVLNHFARLCALKVIDKWDAPDAVRAFLNSGDEKLREAASKSLPEDDKYQDAKECAEDIILLKDFSARQLVNYCWEECCNALVPDYDFGDDVWEKEKKKLGLELEQMIRAEAKRLHKIK